MTTLWKIAATLLAVVFLVMAFVLYSVWWQPRPTDTTDTRIFDGDPYAVDYCAKVQLDGSGLTADDIPKAYTPHCGFDQWPMPILADCTEPLAPGAEDLRGLWQVVDGLEGHIERVEQCGDRVIVVGSNFIHDFRTTGDLADGANDINPRNCMRIRAAIHWDADKTLVFRAFDLFDVVSRRLEDADTMMWDYGPAETVSRLKRLCRLPPVRLSQARLP